MLIDCFGKHHKIVMIWPGTEGLLAFWRPQQVSNNNSQKNIFCSLLFLEGRSTKCCSRCGVGEEAQAPNSSPLWYSLHLISRRVHKKPLWTVEWFSSRCLKWLLPSSGVLWMSSQNNPDRTTHCGNSPALHKDKGSGFLYGQSHYCLAACWMAAKPEGGWCQRSPASCQIHPPHQPYKPYSEDTCSTLYH